MRLLLSFVWVPIQRMYVEVAAAAEKAADGGWANFTVRDGLVLTTKPASDEDKRGVCYLPRTLSTLPVTRVDPRKPNPKMGVGLIAWSKDGRYLVCSVSQRLMRIHFS